MQDRQTSQIYVQMFGGLLIHFRGKEPLHFPSRQTATLLACLALNPGRPQTREALCSLIWPESSSEEGRHNLRQSLYSLRSKLKTFSSDLLLTTDTTVQLNPDRVYTDLMLFEATLLRASESTDIQERIRCLDEAIALRAGELLPQFYLDIIQSERIRLTHCYERALIDLAESLGEVGKRARAIQVARQAIAIDPLLEEAHRLIMQLHIADGHPAAAIRQYQELERQLRADLDAEPSVETRTWLVCARQNPAAADATIAVPVEAVVPIVAVEEIAKDRTPASPDTGSTRPDREATIYTRSVYPSHSTSPQPVKAKSFPAHAPRLWVFGAVIVLLLWLGKSWNAEFFTLSGGSHSTEARYYPLANDDLHAEFVVQNPQDTLKSLHGVAALEYVQHRNPWNGLSDTIQPHHDGLDGLDGMAIKVTGAVQAKDRYSIILVVKTDLLGNTKSLCATAWANCPLDNQRQLKIDHFQQLIRSSINVVPEGISTNPHDGDFYLRICREKGETQLIKLFHADWNDNYRVDF